ncbi:terminase TerL endonuclease subunit [Culicoidibacter larvae]|uniref:Terminase large subunit n=1 Tax=Culicoidibacter larvae TaxID=2579976 RepID=A0A5R8Q8L9_9FIRM|nr:terminase TerL endonuclease subunit [Culicoidibacter larvae]TLG72058.1 terminase large subunit [Culicoidibacter larvae]
MVVVKIMNRSRNCKYVDEYRKKVEMGIIKVNKDRFALFDYLDLLDSKEDNYFDMQIIEDYISITEAYFFPLLDWQKFFASYFLGYRQSDGILRFNEFLLLMGRGGGKSGFGASLAFFLTSKKNGIDKYGIDFIATSEDQAKIMYEEIYDMLNNWRPTMKKSFDWTKTAIVNKATKSKIRYRTSNARTKDGGRQGAVFFDEVHGFSSYDSIKVFRSGLNKVADNRTLYLTTNGDIRDSVLDDMIEMSELVLKEYNPADKFFPFICRLDDEEQVKDFDNWEMANPSITVFPILKDGMITEYNKGLKHSETMYEFMTKRMNMPFKNALNEVTSWENIKRASRELPDLKGKNAIGGIDFASFKDFCAVGLLFKENDQYYYITHGFITKQAIFEQGIKAPLDTWAKDGLITIVDDTSISAQHTLNWFVEMSKDYNVGVIACDSYRFDVLKEIYSESPFELKCVRSGYITHNKLAPLIEDVFDRDLISYGDNPFMRWNVNNVYVDVDAKGNKSYKKKEYKTRKTDAFMAMIHAFAYRDELPVAAPILNIDWLDDL